MLRATEYFDYNYVLEKNMFLEKDKKWWFKYREYDLNFDPHRLIYVPVRLFRVKCYGSRGSETCVPNTNVISVKRLLLFT